MMQIRSIVPYDIYFHCWHRERSRSGDAVNDKSSHHFDVFNWFAESRAEVVTGFGGRAVYLSDPGSPHRCRECSRECPYRVGNQRSLSPDDMVRLTTDDAASDPDMARWDDMCVYYPGADILDHASVQVRYRNGVLASLLYCLFGPRAPDQETLELVGSTGRLILTRHTGDILVLRDHGRQVEHVDCRPGDFKTSHFGADMELVRHLREFCDGAPARVSEREGLEATRMAMAAIRSVDANGRPVRMEEMMDVQPCGRVP